MAQEFPDRTWDGVPIAKEPPFGAAVVVYRRTRARLELLLLHRAHYGPDYEGDWAWTPPSGARQPGEPVEVCAQRELQEETGLRLALRPTGIGLENWCIYLAEASLQEAVSLEDTEHDRFLWLPPADALARCAPEEVRTGLAQALAYIESAT